MNEWTEETVRPHMFTEVEMSNGCRWFKEKLHTYDAMYKRMPFRTYDGVWYKYMRPIAKSTEAEEILAKWKGKKVTTEHLSKAGGWLIITHLEDGKLHGKNEKGEKDFFWPEAFSNIIPWEPPKRTAKEWLKELPEHIYKLLPPEGHDAWYMTDREVDNLDDALNLALTWSKTEQGDRFWNEVYKASRGERPYPEAPVDPTLLALIELRDHIERKIQQHREKDA